MKFNPKEIVIITVIVVLNILFWLWLKPWLAVINPFDTSLGFGQSSWGINLRPLITLILLAAAMSLGLVVLHDRRLKWLIGGLVGLGFLLVQGFSPLYVAGIALLAIFYWDALTRIETEIRERNTINIWAILRHGTWSIVTPILILVSFVYYTDLSAQPHQVAQRTPNALESVVDWGVKFASEHYYRADATPAERAYYERDVKNQVLTQLSTFVKPYERYIPPLLAFTLFIIIQGLSFIFVWLSIELSRLVFWTLRKTGFVMVTTREVKAEVINL